MRPIDHTRVISLALIAIARAAATAACGSSASKPAAAVTQPAPTQPTATQAPTTTQAPPRRFISQRYGFRVILPQHWSALDALVNWNGKEEGLDLPDFVNLTDTATGQSVAAAATPLPNGMSLAHWRAATVRAAPSVCSESPSAEKTTLGAEPALAWTATCTDGYYVNKLAALHGNRGYLILLASRAGTDHAKDRRIFESIRRSFHFTHD
jgi:hypothetical protein